MENPPSRGSPGRTAATSEVNPIRVASAGAWGKLGDVRRDPLIVVPAGRQID